MIPEQSLVLGEAVVIAHRPVYELKNGKLITNVQNSLLSKIGTASDVLNHIPGVQGKDGCLFRVWKRYTFYLFELDAWFVICQNWKGLDRRILLGLKC